MSDRLAAELEAIRSLRNVARRRRAQRSRLDRYRAEIESLASAGASSYDIALWLRKFKRTRSLRAMDAPPDSTTHVVDYLAP